LLPNAFYPHCKPLTIAKKPKKLRTQRAAHSANSANPQIRNIIVFFRFVQHPLQFFLYLPFNMYFTWDEEKNKANVKKHGVSFKQAAMVF
jgi:hypothetical protein